MNNLESRLIKALEEQGIPEYMHGGVIRYVIDGVEPGGFLTALFCNDFKEVVGRADLTNQSLLVQWARFIYNDVPAPCQGSREKFDSWIANGGIKNEMQ